MGHAELQLHDAVTDYAMRVVDGTEVAGPWVRLACQRHLDDLEHGPARGLAWHADRAAHAIGFIECLRHYQGATAGQRFTLSPFQRFIVGSLFGWYVGEGRRFRVGYVEIGKGNGKTPLAAGIALYGLVADGEAGAEVYSAATSRDQAGICFNDALEFVRASPPLLQRLSLGKANLAYLATSSFFRPVSAEGKGLDGKRPHVVVVDELHEHPSGIVVEKMRAGTKGRTRALIFEITNSGYDQTSVCWEHHDYSTKVLQGVLQNDAWFAYIAALDKGDQPFDDETCWRKANPNLGVSLTPEYLREQVLEARNIPSKRSLVLRLNFCRWTQASENWVDLDKWDACGQPVDEALLAGRPCYGGLDLASVSDLNALVWLFPPIEADPLWRLVMRCWLPEQTLRLQVEKAFLPYDLWHREGLLRTTPGNVADYAFIKKQIAEDMERFDVREIAYDRWNATSLVTELMDEHSAPMVQFGQGFASMSAPMKELERIYLSALLAHGGNPLLRWMASNLVATQDPAGNIKPDRAESRSKIDGMVATVMALGRAIAPHEAVETVDSYMQFLKARQSEQSQGAEGAGTELDA
ncbi:MAG: terminase large subunit [Piscinibacter sp.]|nr:terminase large subunit [Piscinibacter sp.]